MRRRLVLGAATALMLLLALAGPAGAHAVLLATDPSDGAELDRAPDQVVLEFNEPVEAPAQAVRVFGGDGERVDRGDVGVGDRPNTVRVGLPEDLPDGVYTVAWRAISADTHPIRGAFVFVVGELAEGAEVAAFEGAIDDEQRGMSAFAALLRWLVYAGALLAAGGALFLVFVHDRTPGEHALLGRVVVAAALAAAIGTVLGVPAQTALATGLGAAAAIDPDLLAGTISSNFGLAGLVRLAGLAVLLVGVARLRRAGGVPLVAVGVIGTVGSYLLVGHTAVSEPRALVLASNFAHTLAAAVWFGGLVLLGMALRRRRVDDDAAGGAGMVGRFSTLALGSVAVLVAAGVALTWVEVRAVSALFTTTYGRLLVVKLVLVAGLVAIAAYNNRRLVPAVAGGSPAAWQRLASTVRWEVIGVTAVLAVTAALVVVLPGRVAAGIGEPAVVTVPLGDTHELHAVVDPAQAGFNEIHLYVWDETGQQSDIGQEVTLRLSLPGQDIAPVEREPARAGPGHYLHAGPELSIPGRWTIELRLLVSDFERLTAAFDVDVR